VQRRQAAERCTKNRSKEKKNGEERKVKLHRGFQVQCRHHVE
jgi:hypothetical protein